MINGGTRMDFIDEPSFFLADMQNLVRKTFSPSLTFLQLVSKIFLPARTSKPFSNIKLKIVVLRNLHVHI